MVHLGILELSVVKLLQYRSRKINSLQTYIVANSLFPGALRLLPRARGEEGTLTIGLTRASPLSWASVLGRGAPGFFGKQHGPPALGKLEQQCFQNVLP